MKLGVLVLTTVSFAQNPVALDPGGEAWVDSVFDSLDTDGKIGQLFMAPCWSNRGESHHNEVNRLIKEYRIGGILFFQGGPLRQARQTNSYQSKAQIPLLVAMDGEWGLGMRLDSTVNFPYQMTLGAIEDDSLIYKMGVQIALNFRRLGVHMNFAPVADVNNNPSNPVINYRSFGEDKQKVADKSWAYAAGLQANRVLAVAKHFPGHGDTNVDSHDDLPVVRHTHDRLQEIELYPFQQLIDRGVGGIMVAHMSIPALEPTVNLPSTLSRPIVSQLLKETMHFEGLVVTDAMNMKGVTKYHPTGEAELKALMAGNDVVEYSENIPVAIEAVKKALRNGSLTQVELDEKCRKILTVKYWAGLGEYQPIQISGLYQDLNNPQINLTNRNLVEASVTVLRNQDDLIPIQDLEFQRIATLSIQKVKGKSAFQGMLENYASMDHFNLVFDATSGIKEVREKLTDYSLVIVGLDQVRKRPSNNKAYSAQVVGLVNELAADFPAIICVMRNAYTLSQFKSIHQAKGLVLSYEGSDNSEDLAAQLLFGGIGAKGRLPVSVNEHFRAGDGLDSRGGIRFKYTLPEDVGMSSSYLRAGIDSLVNQAMEVKATPGAQVLVAKDGKVVFWESYGYQSYFDTIPVRPDDLYDLASITKVTASLPLLMELVDQRLLDLDGTLGEYVGYLKGSDKADLTIREILAHQAGLKPWIPYWKTTLKRKGGYKGKTFQKNYSEDFPIKITDSLFLHKDYKKKIYRAIKKSPLEQEPRYLYSGLSFYLWPEMIQDMTGEQFELRLFKDIFLPLGATRLTFNPSQNFPLNKIVPTEFDLQFRRVMIHGKVHDEGAALMDGISSNAGLFGNANDLAKLFQMYVNLGEYGGRRYIQESTLREFTRIQFPENQNRRGLGFDKPQLEFSVDGNASKFASPASFGHTGFTGTRAWADPEYNLVYVFLSNRVHPFGTNTRLYRLNTRTEIERVIYESFEGQLKH